MEDLKCFGSHRDVITIPFFKNMTPLPRIIGYRRFEGTEYLS
jgi:hypothetical protein